MIVGIGTDLCDIRRIRASLERHGERFAGKVLGPNEMGIYRARSERALQRGVTYVATRFSAKEAFSKALGTGMRMPMTWRACEILNRPNGQPYIQLHGALAERFESAGWRAHVTVTDEHEYAASFVVIEHDLPHR